VDLPTYIMILNERRSRSLCVPGSDIVVGECSFASRRAGAGTGRAGKPQLRHGRRIWGDGPEQQSKGAVSPLSEQRGHTSGGSHSKAQYNVEQPTRLAPCSYVCLFALRIS